jgi:Fe-S-cluster-containing hydrogenase component 2
MSLLLHWLESLTHELQITSRCTRVTSPKSTCTICLESCPNKAIIFDKKNIVIDSTKCNGCGQCVLLCPTSAIIGSPPSRNFEKNRLVYDPSHPSPTEKELLIYVASGLRGVVMYETEMNPGWKMAIEVTNEMLKDLDEPQLEVEYQNKLTEKLTRRDLFLSVKAKSRHFAQDFSPASWRIKEDGWKLSNYFPKHQCYQVELNQEKCTLCQACFKLCPEKLFTITDTVVNIKNQPCTNCSLCTDICPENAITIKQKTTPKTEQSYTVLTKQCPTCQQPYQTFNQTTEKCHTCTKRDSTWLR